MYRFSGSNAPGTNPHVLESPKHNMFFMLTIKFKYSCENRCCFDNQKKNNNMYNTQLIFDLYEYTRLFYFRHTLEVDP